MLEGICEWYTHSLKMEYKSHIEKAIEIEESRKDEIASQLSEDEKKLQDDKEWLTKLLDQIVAIERE